MEHEDDVLPPKITETEDTEKKGKYLTSAAASIGQETGWGRLPTLGGTSEDIIKKQKIAPHFLFNGKCGFGFLVQGPGC